MEWNLRAMLATQQKVNDKVMEKLDNAPSASDYLLAMHVEVYEFINAIGTWKWWKHNHVPNREKILDELADIMAFYFSFLLTLDDDKIIMTEEVMDEIYGELDGYENNAILQYITQCLNDGVGQAAPVLMVESIILAGNTINATWQDIEKAYYAKSEVNIKRQEQNY